MRIITLYQPYATLMMLGLKQNETRSFKTRVRGELGIHAAASIPNWCKMKMAEQPFKSALKGIDLPTGKILGTVELIDCVTTSKFLCDQAIYTARTWDEISFGDYSPGRFAWITKNPIPFEKPIIAKGSQGFWKYEPPAGSDEEAMIYGDIYNR